MPRFPVSDTTFPLPARLGGAGVFYALRLIDMEGWRVREDCSGLSFWPDPAGMGSYLPWAGVPYDPAYLGC